MDRINRRRFLERTITGAGSLALTPVLAGSRSFAGSRSATDRIELGHTGIKVSRVAIGTGFNGGNRQSNQTRAGQESFTRLMREGFEDGLNFYDMADLYGSHKFMRPFLKEVPRDRVVLLSKIWFTDSGIMEATDRAIPSVERFLGELDTDALDLCLIHCVTTPTWPSELNRMRDELSQLKEKGLVRAVGCSCHGFEALRTAAEHPWVDVIFARINNRGNSMDVPDPDAVAKVLKTARSNGKAVVGMKIYGAGSLTESEQRDSSLRFVWGNDLVDAMTVGFEKPEQIKDTIGHLNRVLKA